MNRGPAGMLLSDAGFFAAAVCFVAFWQVIGLFPEQSRLVQERNFFGVLGVVETVGKRGAVRALYHGTTLHGDELINDPEAPPGAYYHPSTPLGSVMQSMPTEARIGVVGLGTGALAALTKEGPSLVWFEIDADVEQVAWRWFGFLKRSRAAMRIVIGDARLMLEREPDRSLDLLIVDAFSSDAIPAHLLTLEAIDLYLRKLDHDGILLLHLSNRHLDLDRVAFGAAHVRGLEAVLSTMTIEPGSRALPSNVVALAANPRALDRLGPGWATPDSRQDVVWTDDRSSILSVIEFGRLRGANKKH